MEHIVVEKQLLNQTHTHENNKKKLKGFPKRVFVTKESFPKVFSFKKSLIIFNEIF